jgi:hypothetical protein
MREPRSGRRSPSQVLDKRNLQRALGLLAAAGLRDEASGIKRSRSMQKWSTRRRHHREHLAVITDSRQTATG